jgi:hypothetical protein
MQTATALDHANAGLLKELRELIDDGKPNSSR